MTDDELDRMVATLAPVSDRWVAGLDLGDAEAELLEEIMAIAPTRVDEAQHPAPGRHRLRLVVAIGAVAAAVLAVVAIRSADKDEDIRPIESTTTSVPPAGAAPRPLISAEPPDGLEILHAGDSRSFGPGFGQPAEVQGTYYGDVTSPEPTNDVVIMTFLFDQVVVESPQAVDVTVRGRPGRARPPVEDPDALAPAAALVGWMEGSGRSVVIASRSLDVDALLALADGLVERDGKMVLGDVPAGMGPFPETDVAAGAALARRSVAYTGPGEVFVDGGPRLEASVYVDGVSDTIELFWIYALDAERVQVRGHDGLFFADAVQVLTWEEAPGVRVEIFAMPDITRDELIAFAETLRPATDEEWTTLVEEFPGETE